MTQGCQGGKLEKSCLQVAVGSKGTGTGVWGVAEGPQNYRQKRREAADAGVSWWTGHVRHPGVQNGSCEKF